MAPQRTIKTGHSAAWVNNNRFINFQKRTDWETENVFPLLSKRMQNKTNIYKPGHQAPAFDSYKVYNTPSPLPRMQRHSVLSHCSTTVCPKSRAGLVEKCWNIWKIKQEDQTSNSPSRQFANSEDSGKQFVSGPIRYRGNFLHWFPDDSSLECFYLRAQDRCNWLMRNNWCFSIFLCVKSCQAFRSPLLQSCLAYSLHDLVAKFFLQGRVQSTDDW